MQGAVRPPGEGGGVSYGGMSGRGLASVAVGGGEAEDQRCNSTIFHAASKSRALVMAGKTSDAARYLIDDIENR